MRCENTTCRDAPCIRLVHDGASALVALHGAQVVSWLPADGRERLFLGKHARFGDGKAIRGGIPVIFPQFSDRGPWRRHGFARITRWTFAGVERDAAVFALDGSDTDGWPHRHALRLRVTLAEARLDVMLEVRNSGETPFDFSAALHAYLRVPDLDAVALLGLGDRDYEDNAEHGAVHHAAAGALHYRGEVDRLYGGVDAPLLLDDGGQRLRIDKHGFEDIVTWNPGADVAAGIDDLAAGEYRHFVCVEAAQVLHPVHLAPGARWQGSEILG